MRLIDADKAKEQIKQMETLKPSERMLVRLALDRTPTYAPPNPPLTLEELREMKGGPSVWVVIGKRGFYDVFCDVSTDGIAQFYRAALPEDEYGKTWLAYRRKSEEVEM